MFEQEKRLLHSLFRIPGNFIDCTATGKKKNKIKSLTSVFILIFWSIDWSIEYQLRKGVLFDKKRIRRMKKNVRSFFHLFMLHLYIYHMYMPLYTV